MWSRIRRQPLIGRMIARYDQLSPRDRQALSVLAFALLVAFLYFVVWRPVTHFHDQAVASRNHAGELLAWIRSNQAAIEALGTGEKASAGANREEPADGRELIALITRTAGEDNLSLQRFEPSGENAVRVWMNSVSFSRAVGWLERLTEDHGVIIDQASVDRTDEVGLVSIRLTLTI